MAFISRRFGVTASLAIVLALIAAPGAHAKNWPCSAKEAELLDAEAMGNYYVKSAP